MDLGLEIKTTTGFAYSYQDWGPDGTDEIPHAYMCQCQWYMAVKGWDRWDLYVFINRDDIRLYRIERDEAFIQGLISAAEKFWEAVKSGTPPDPDPAHTSTGPLLRRMYPGTSGETLQLGREAQVWRNRVKALRAAKRRIKKAEKFYKNRIRAVMGEAAIGELPASGSIKRSLTRRKGYTVDPKEYVSLRIN